MRLTQQEFIQRVTIRCDDWVEALTLVTKFGIGDTVCNPVARYEFRAPKGAQLIGIEGLASEQVDAISCIFATIERPKLE